MSESPLDFSRLRRETWLRHLEHHETLPSTNDRAMVAVAEAALPCPALIIAERQTAGRGRGGHVWESGPGALTFSLILERPALLPRERTPLVSLVAGLAVREAISGVAPTSLVQVKWPNDVYLAGKKIAGILTETNSAAPDRLIVGIGINVNNSLEGAPSEWQGRAISLADYLSTRVEPTDLLVALFVTLESELDRLARTGEIDVERWRPHCLLTGREISVQTGSTLHTGRCRGVGINGAIHLEGDQGVIPIYAGEVLRYSRSIHTRYET